MKKITIQIPVAECQLTIEYIEQWIIDKIPPVTENPYHFRLEAFVLEEIRSSLFTAIGSARKKEKAIASLKLAQPQIDCLSTCLLNKTGIETTSGILLKHSIFKRPNKPTLTSIDTSREITTAECGL
ncbi:hypothetical protein [Phaeocystidibacter marisrubri]|uniref:Uncharacterized protein n=1 Tax=Phaeocystidibacter marisrubri TaxID=1577780 RepID=A0A6L3ZBL7_9FLAO|nr:hypothetical protein [Phaeocystidibacter marisrubri]KAB2815027.1 hypothetical protein F8C82_14540 [Phaeocystidibacter marisrubri]GGH78118.1 hypothetical protein GCM10011318_28860 [Phaeocystidibacter marisrubri]